MRLDTDGENLIKSFEKCRLSPYLDIGGFPTIGWGNRFYENGLSVKIVDPPISQQRANDLFSNISADFAKFVSLNVSPLLVQNQFNACVSLCYNIGKPAFKNSTLLKLINYDNLNVNILPHFLEWNRVNKIPVAGLTQRRKIEAAIYFNQKKKI